VRQLRATIERAVVLCRGERIGLRDLPPDVQGKPNSGGIGSPGGEGNSASGNLNLEEMEKSFIQRALKLTEGNVTEAAKLLGISRRTLHRKIKTYNLDSP
jgi:transcriptional regulator of acetoin/glycerol metabolism